MTQKLVKHFKILAAVSISVLVIISILIFISKDPRNPYIEILKISDEVKREELLSIDLQKLNSEELSRIDCFLDAESEFEKLTEYACEKRNCIYKPDTSHPLVPKCYYDRENLGYKLINQTSQFEFDLEQYGRTPFPGVIKRIRLAIEYLGNNIVRVKIYDPLQQRYEVPIEIFKPKAASNFDNTLASFEYTINEKTNLFEWKIVRRDNNQVLFDSSNGAFVFNKQFLQISTKLASDKVYGFGENNHESFKHNLNFKSWGMFARDQGPGWGVSCVLFKIFQLRSILIS
jgi:hypothetical protein